MINSKFQELANYLQIQDCSSIELSFSQIERILGFQLCSSARKYRVYWYKSKTHMLPLVCDAAGFIIDSVDINNEKVLFVKKSGRQLDLDYGYYMHMDTCNENEERIRFYRSELKNIFNKANNEFLDKESKLILDDVAERCLCGTLKSYLERELANTKYMNYHVDTEYNRNCGQIKTILNGKFEVIKIQCDLLIHSRGEQEFQDNLVALEMKKSYQNKKSKDEDRDRLCALTKDKHNSETYSYDGKTFPKQVCGYILGIYYEVDKDNEKILIEYYSQGRLVGSYEKKIK